MKIKALITGLCVVGAVVTAKANYDITFQTYDLVGDPGLADHFVFLTGTTTRITGPTFLGQLYVGANAGSLGPIGSPVAFAPAGSGAEGYIDSGTISVTDPTLNAGSSAVYVLRAWNASAGATFEAASVAPGGIFGSSAVTPITLGGTVPGTPPTLLTATANLHASFPVGVPEPSVLALGLLGGAALILRRRK